MATAEQYATAMRTRTAVAGIIEPYLAPGKTLPISRVIAIRAGVSHVTVCRHIAAILAAKGLVTRQDGNRLVVMSAQSEAFDPWDPEHWLP